MIRYVIFTGASLSGKSTAASFLRLTLAGRGLKVSRDSFEMPMRHYLCMLLGLKSNSVEMDAPISLLLSKTARDFVLREAAHMRFSYGPGVLGKLLDARSRSNRGDNQFVIVDDGSSITDIQGLESYFLVRIERSKVERVYPFVIPNPDMVVLNDRDVKHLQEKMREVADVLVETLDV